VLAQGSTAVNGPHQGGYIETPSGEGWFVHFHSQGAYGRIDYLEPVKWVDDWPIMGKPINDTTGEPVLSWKKPDVGGSFPAQRPQTSDEFTGRKLGQQWEWNHNPDDAHWSLSARPGFMRLTAMPANDFLHARNTLTQMMQDPAFDLTVRIDLKGMKSGQQAGLAMLSNKPSGVRVVDAAGKRSLVFFTQSGDTAGPSVSGNLLQLRVHIDSEMATYSYSMDDGKSFQPLGEPARIYFSWWKAARPSIFSFNADSNAKEMGAIDVDWVHYQPAKELAAN
jgi:beta-xylosidase